LLAAVLQDLPWSSVLLQTPLLVLPHSNSKVVGVPEVIFREEIAVRVKTAFNALEMSIGSERC
jgi:hypothetical protein